MQLLKLSACPLEKGRRSSLFFPWTKRQPAGHAITQMLTSGHLPRLDGACLRPRHSSANATRLTLFHTFLTLSRYIWVGRSEKWKVTVISLLMKSEGRLELMKAAPTLPEGRCVTLSIYGRVRLTLSVMTVRTSCRSVTFKPLMISQAARCL